MRRSNVWIGGPVSVVLSTAVALSACGSIHGGWYAVTRAADRPEPPAASAVVAEPTNHAGAAAVSSVTESSQDPNPNSRLYLALVNRTTRWMKVDRIEVHGSRVWWPSLILPSARIETDENEGASRGSRPVWSESGPWEFHPGGLIVVPLSRDTDVRRCSLPGDVTITVGKRRRRVELSHVLPSALPRFMERCSGTSVGSAADANQRKAAAQPDAEGSHGQAH